MLATERQWFIWGSLVAITLVFIGAVAVNAHPALRGPADWRWTYAIPGQPTRHLIGAAVVLVYAAIVWRWGRRLGGRPPLRTAVMGYLLFCALAAPVIQVALLAGESPDVVQQLYFRTVSPGSSGFFAVASAIDDVTDFLAQYPALMPTFPVHPQRYPPGIALLFYASRAPLAVGGVGEAIGAALRPYQCTDLTLMRIANDVMGTAVLQMLLPLLSGLVIFPLFGLARRTLGWDTAVWAVAFYPLVPSFALWAGRWDQFFPLLTATAWYLLVVGLTASKRWPLFLSGVVLALAAMLSFGLLVMLAPMALWVLFWLGDRRTAWTWRRLFTDGLFFVTGLVLVWLIYQLIVGPGFLDIWRVSMDYHLGVERGYWTWLGYHLYDFAIFLGLPLALLSLFTFFYALLAMGHGRATPRGPATPLPLAFGLALLLLDLSGVARGEVARVWIFLTPFAVICAAWGLTRLANGRWPVLLLLALLGLQLLAFNAFFRVVNTGLTSIPAREFVTEPAAAARPLWAQFGDEIHLSGYEVTQQTISGQRRVEVTLYWQADGRVSNAYTVFTHLVAADGQLAAQQDGMPVHNTWPTTCWRPGEVVADSYTIILDANITPGAYQLFTGLYHPESGERLPVTSAVPSAANALLLDIVAVQKP